MSEPKTKKFLYINRKAPYGTIYALESLEVVLIGAAFEQDVALAFLDDSIYQITKGQETSEIGMKNFSKTYQALGDFDVNKIYVEKEIFPSLISRLVHTRRHFLIRVSYQFDQFHSNSRLRAWLSFLDVANLVPKHSRSRFADILPRVKNNIFHHILI